MKALEHEADPLAADLRLFVGGKCGDVATFQAVVPRVGSIQQAQQIEEGRLPRPGRAHDGDVFARFYAKAYVAQRMDVGVTEMEDAFDAL